MAAVGHISAVRSQAQAPIDSANRRLESGSALADAKAVERIAAGDSEALAELYDRYSNLVHGMAYRLLKDAQLAEECTQDVFIAIWRRADSYDRERARVTTWLFTITRNRAIELVRRRQARPADPYAEIEAPGEAPDPSALVVQADTSQRIAEAMAELPESQSQALQLAYFEGLTHVEISERLNLPVGTVKGRIRLGLDRLRTVADQYELAA